MLNYYFQLSFRLFRLLAHGACFNLKGLCFRHCEELLGWPVWWNSVAICQLLGWCFIADRLLRRSSSQ